MRAQLVQHFKDNNFPEQTVSELMTAYDGYVEQGSSEEEALAQLKAKYFGKPAQQEAKASLDYRGALFASLSAKKSGLSKDAISTIMKAFAEMEAKSGSVAAFEVCLSHWGNQLPSQALEAYASQITYRLPQTQIGQQLERSLVEANKQVILKDPVSRTKRAVSHFNKWVAKCSCTVNNVFTGREIEVLSDEEKNALAIHLSPKKENAIMEYQSWGATKAILSNNLTALEFE